MYKSNTFNEFKKNANNKFHHTMIFMFKKDNEIL